MQSIIPNHGAWSAAWTRALYFAHIPTIFHDRVYFVDKPHSQGSQRDWFIEVWFERKVIPVWLMSQSFQTSGTSVTLGSLSPAWNNANNFVEGIGGGGSGAATKLSSAWTICGAGGGEYREIANFSDPGGATPMQIGQGGTAAATATGSGAQQVNGNDGTSTTFNTSSLIANPGIKGTAASGSQNGGLGGTGGTGAAANNVGGRGGDGTSPPTANIVTGGGGAGGPNGVGGNGGDGASISTNSSGGQGDGSSGGGGGTGTNTTPGGNGTAGTELGDSVHGCGGGGGACRVSTNGAAVAGSGALYGAGGGGCSNGGGGNNSATKATSGAGAIGIIVLTWTASAATQVYVFTQFDDSASLIRAIRAIGYH